MIIHHFSVNQNDVFVPALLWLLVAVVLICGPILFGQMLRRTGRAVPVGATAAVLAVGALVLTGWQATTAFGALGTERAHVRAEIAQRYDLRLTSGQVGELIDGGKPALPLPSVAAAAGLTDPQKAKTLKLVPTSPTSDVYDLEIGGHPWPTGQA